ncbi:MAG TPA: hypothetical protein VF735_09460 [Pyrinomonadaceae bacterium]|jgi:hypothetical protein
MATPVFKFVSYDTTKYPFAKVFAEHVIHTDDLSRYHEVCLKRKRERGEEGVITYRDNLVTRQRLKRAAERPWFFKLYRAFVVNIFTPLFGGKMTYNWPPVFRVHMGNSPSISALHRDTEVTGRHDLIAVWVPFVDTFGTNTIWVETEYGNKELAPVAVRYGQALMFDSGYLWHASVANTTNVTRFGMDFRVAPKRTDVEAPDLGILKARPIGYETQLSDVTPGAQYDRAQKIVREEVA